MPLLPGGASDSLIASAVSAVRPELPTNECRARDQNVSISNLRVPPLARAGALVHGETYSDTGYVGSWISGLIRSSTKIPCHTMNTSSVQSLRL